jgi:hypothetical protein
MDSSLVYTLAVFSTGFVLIMAAASDFDLW